MANVGPSTDQPQKQESHYESLTLTINDRWVLKKKLGKGGYGVVYSAIDKEKDTKVAVKVDISHRVNIGSYRAREILREEYEIMRKITAGVSENETIGFPRPIFYASGDFMRVLVMELLGTTILQAFNKDRTCPQLADVYVVGIQLIFRLEHLHNHGFVHLDLKSDNIFFGRDANKDRVYLADFGLSEKYLKEDGTHRPNAQRGYSVGTASFASRNVLNYETPSRRDDIESLGYVLLHLFFKTLPWMDHERWHKRHYERNPDGLNNLMAANPGFVIESTKQEQLQGVLEMKTNYPLDKLCRGMPGMKEFLEHAKQLKYDEKPNYSYLRRSLRRKICRLCMPPAAF